MNQESNNRNSLEALKLENQICFPLYACAKEVVRQYRPFLDELNLTYTQYITLMVLWNTEEINIKALGEKLYLDSGTMTPVLKSLESKGFIRRSRSSADERVVLVSITPEGERLKQTAVTIPPKIASCVALDEKEAVELYRLLYKVLDSLQEKE